METITFENLPAAVSLLLKEVNSIKLALQSGAPEPPDQPMTVQQTADFFGNAKSTIYGMISRGELPYLKRGKKVYFQKTDLLNYLKAGRRKSYQEIKEGRV